MFASVGADGSVRMFDLRHLEHSTIIYEDPQHHPLLRLCWNKQDPNYLATMAMDGMEVRQCYLRVTRMSSYCVCWRIYTIARYPYLLRTLGLKLEATLLASRIS